MSRRVIHDGRRSFQIRFPFDRGLVDLVKTLPNRRWNSSDRFWSAPEKDAVPVVDLLIDEGFSFDEATQERYVEQGGTRSFETAVAPGQSSLFDDPESPSEGGYTVLELNERVREILQSAFPDSV